MPSLIAVADGFNLLGFPLLAIAAMFASKLTVGKAARLADRWYLAAFALQSLVTLRTVMNCDTAWLLHMLTLMILIVGTVVVPSLRDLDAQPTP